MVGDRISALEQREYVRDQRITALEVEVAGYRAVLRVLMFLIPVSISITLLVLNVWRE